MAATQRSTVDLEEVENCVRKALGIATVMSNNGGTDSEQLTNAADAIYDQLWAAQELLKGRAR